MGFRSFSDKRLQSSTKAGVQLRKPKFMDAMDFVFSYLASKLFIYFLLLGVSLIHDGFASCFFEWAIRLLSSIENTLVSLQIILTHSWLWRKSSLNKFRSSSVKMHLPQVNGDNRYTNVPGIFSRLTEKIIRAVFSCFRNNNKREL